MHCLQELLPQFFLSLYFSVASSKRICLKVKATQGLYCVCWCSKTREGRTHSGRDGIASLCLTSKLPFHDHRAPNRNHHVPVPSTLSTSFQLWVRSESSVSPYPELLYCSVHHLCEQPLLSTLFSGLHKCFISFSKIETVTVIQLFTQPSSCVDLPRYAASAGQQITQHTTWPKPGSEFYFREKKESVAQATPLLHIVEPVLHFLPPVKSTLFLRCHFFYYWDASSLTFLLLLVLTEPLAHSWNNHSLLRCAARKRLENRFWKEEIPTYNCIITQQNTATTMNDWGRRIHSCQIP